MAILVIEVPRGGESFLAVVKESPVFSPQPVWYPLTPPDDRQAVLAGGVLALGHCREWWRGEGEKRK